MNLLQVQDALKNASDQQLQQEMGNPQGMAPQFLVLSEIKRRKDMRGSQPAPQGTVAEELTHEMARGGLVGLRGFASGGTLYMNPGMGTSNAGNYMDPSQIQRTLYMQRAPGMMAPPPGPAAPAVDTEKEAADAAAKHAAEIDEMLRQVGPMGNSAEMGGQPGTDAPGGMVGAPGGFSSSTPSNELANELGVSSFGGSPGGASAGSPSGPGVETAPGPNPEDNGWARGGVVGLRRFASGDEVTAQYSPFRNWFNRQGPAYTENMSAAARQMMLENARTQQSQSPVDWFANSQSDWDAAPARKQFLDANADKFRTGAWSVEDFQKDPDGFIKQQTATRAAANNEPSPYGVAAETDRPNEGLPPAQADTPATVDTTGYSDDIGPRAPDGTRRAGLPGAARGGAGGAGAPRIGGGIAALARDPGQAAAAEAGGEKADPTQSRWDEMRKDLAASREDPATARKDAANMALIEAGLRIAGSQSPHLGAALSEAAPSVQSYTQQMNAISKGRKEDAIARIQLENAVTTDRYRHDMSENQKLQIASNERNTAAHVAATLGAAGISAQAHITAAQLAASHNPHMDELKALEDMRINNPDGYAEAVKRMGRDQMSLRVQAQGHINTSMDNIERLRDTALKAAAERGDTAAAIGINNRYDALKREQDANNRRLFPDMYGPPSTAPVSANPARI